MAKLRRVLRGRRDALLEALETHLPEGATFGDLLEGARREAAHQREHELVPLPAIQSVAQCRDPLFDHVFVYENYPVAASVARAIANGIAVVVI